MKYIINLIQRILRKELPKPLGRWNLEYCDLKLNNKVGLSNEDHCGSCGQYAVTKNELNNKNISLDNSSKV